MLRLQLQKERLMAFIVHDLKNPVNSMDLHAQVCSARTRAPGERARVRRRRSAPRRGSSARMILNLLDVSKADEGQLAPKRIDVDLRRLVDEVVAELGIERARAAR